MKYSILPFLLIFLMVIAASCIKQTEQPLPNQNPNTDSTKPDPYSCSRDSDCAVKDVHNCCGYYPRCVNKNFIPDIEAVKRECREKGIASICGFPDITACKCVENKCTSVQSSNVV